MLGLKCLLLSSHDEMWDKVGVVILDLGTGASTGTQTQAEKDANVT